MNKRDKAEAERIAGELEKVERVFQRSKQPRIDPAKLETHLLAKACQLFEATLEADPLTPEQRTKKAFAESL